MYLVCPEWNVTFAFHRAVVRDKRHRKLSDIDRNTFHFQYRGRGSAPRVHCVLMCSCTGRERSWIGGMSRQAIRAIILTISFEGLTDSSPTVGNVVCVRARESNTADKLKREGERAKPLDLPPAHPRQGRIGAGRYLYHRRREAAPKRSAGLNDNSRRLPPTVLEGLEAD